MWPCCRWGGAASRSCAEPGEAGPRDRAIFLRRASLRGGSPTPEGARSLKTQQYVRSERIASRFEPLSGGASAFSDERPESVPVKLSRPAGVRGKLIRLDSFP